MQKAIHVKFPVNSRTEFSNKCYEGAFAGTLNQEHLKKALCHWVGKEEIPRMEDILKKTTLTIYYQNTLHNLAQWQSTWAWKSHQQVCTNSLFTLPSIYLTIVHPYHRLCHCFSSHSSCHGSFNPSVCPTTWWILDYQSKVLDYLWHDNLWVKRYICYEHKQRWF